MKNILIDGQDFFSSLDKGPNGVTFFVAFDYIGYNQPQNS